MAKAKVKTKTRLPAVLRIPGEIFPHQKVSLHMIEGAFGYPIEELVRRYRDLTARQREVFCLLGLGKRNSAIADELDISPKTLDIHRADVIHKMEASGVGELAVMYTILVLATIAG